MEMEIPNSGTIISRKIIELIYTINKQLPTEALSMLLQILATFHLYYSVMVIRYLFIAFLLLLDQNPYKLCSIVLF